MHSYAPIALFVYNRPSHTQRTLEALQDNILAEESDLYVFSDGPASSKELEAVLQTRAIVSQPWKFRSIEIIERPVNVGLANNIIDGVSRLVNAHGDVIVFEDDLVASPYALSYFNNALDKYRNENRVMHVSAYAPYLLNRSHLPETFFFRAISSWGWATWQRAWIHFEPDIDRLMQRFDAQDVHAFSLEGSMNFWRQMLEFKQRKNNSWAIRWYASIYLQHGLALTPSISLISNIGHDGTGVHSQRETTYDVKPSAAPITCFPAHIEESVSGYEAMRCFYKNRKGNLYQRGVRFIRNKLHQFIKAANL